MSPKHSLESNKVKIRNRRSVSLGIKHDILRRYEASEKIVDICKALGLPKSTVQSICANKEKIKAHLQSAASLSTSTLTRRRSNNMERMEKLLNLWIEDNNQRNIPMNQITIQEKAKSIFEHLKSECTGDGPADETFQASRGWLEKYKNRHNVYIKKRGEKTSAHPDTAGIYRNILKVFTIQGGGYDPQQVFNVCETPLYWKRMPEGTCDTENVAFEHHVSEKRLTLLLGANAAGNYKLKPLLVYASENTTPLKKPNNKELPAIWKSSRKALMTKILFKDWFTNYFCPDIKKFLKEKNLSNKVLLLLDNSSSYPANLSELSQDVKIEYLPKNVMSLIQPMEQGVITTFKAYYLRKTFQKLLNKTDNELSIDELWKNFNITDAMENISESWNEIRSNTINHAWQNIWPECITNSDSEFESLYEIIQNILNLANELGFKEVKERDVINLLDVENEPLSNEELLQLETNISIDEEQEPLVCRELTPKNISDALSHFRKGINILLKNDPFEERSARVSRDINLAINCYK